MTDARGELLALADEIASISGRCSLEADRVAIINAATHLRRPAPVPQCEAEPVAWVPENYHRWLTPHGAPAQAAMMWKEKSEAYTTPLYAAPPSRLDAVNAPVPSNFSPGDPVEVRLQEEAIDEIVIRRGDVHIEQMSADSWFMGVDASDGSYWQFWFGAKNRKSHVEFRHTETVPAAENAALSTDPGTVAVASTLRETPHD